ncbi:hypothetical protein [Sphingomonas sp. RB1R13]|uniref:hypothetical protein n=1 Tax=Sphingomonas sp. RB1R13 TaxID=3096159 RepID=UPI002FCC5EEA
MTHAAPEKAQAAGRETIISISLSPGDRASAQPKKPVQRPKVAVLKPVPPPLIAMPSISPAAADTADAGDAGVAGGGRVCQLSVDAAAAIQQDPMAMAELAALPPGVRSGADAVMLWNGKWFDQQIPVPAPTATGAVSINSSLRLAIEKMVIAAPTECRDEAMVGPVFVPIPEGDRTTLLAIGSGAWRWSDLLALSALCPGGDPSLCPAALKSP